MPHNVRPGLGAKETAPIKIAYTRLVRVQKSSTDLNLLSTIVCTLQGHQSHRRGHICHVNNRFLLLPDSFSIPLRPLCCVGKQTCDACMHQQMMRSCSLQHRSEQWKLKLAEQTKTWTFCMICRVSTACSRARNWWADSELPPHQKASHIALQANCCSSPQCPPLCERSN